MLIDTSKLDPKLTYHCNEIGTSDIAKVLQDLQHRNYPELDKSKIASHSFFILNRGTGWNVWENHLQWKGIREYCIEDYERYNLNASRKRIEIHQFDFNIDAADYWRDNNPGYSVLDLGKIAAKRLTGIKLINTPGMVCSESLANCGFKICNKLKLKAEYVAPVDWQIFFDCI